MNKLILVLLATAMAAVAQPAKVSGELTVDGKATKLTHVYAYLTQGFFDKEKNDTVVLLTNGPLTEAQFRDEMTLRKLARDGKLCFVKESINDLGQIVNYTVGHGDFRMSPSGASTDHVFEGKADGKTISGKVLTKVTQKSMDAHKYTYSATFTASILPREKPAPNKK